MALLLKQKRIIRVIRIGLIANTCIEATARFASALGYQLTLVRDASAAFSLRALLAAQAIVTTAELLAAVA